MATPNRKLKRMTAKRIYSGLKDQITGGVYPLGGQIPSSRSLATELGVSRTTVTVAFEQLVAEGFIETQPGTRPTVVLSSAPTSTSKSERSTVSEVRLSKYGEALAAMSLPTERPKFSIADFRYGDVSVADFPLRDWKKAYVEALNVKRERLVYELPGGTQRLRKALQGYLWRARGVSCDTDQIIVVNGSQQGLDLCSRVLLNSGDRFVIENPCYRMAREIFLATGARAIPIEVDSEGLDVSKLPKGSVKLAYLTPSHQFPLGSVMSMNRRQRVLEWANQAGSYIVEDDYDSEYRYDIKPIPPLYGLGEEDRVIYSGTVSKIISSAPRLGYLVVPRSLIHVFTMAKMMTDRHTSLFTQNALASMIEAGAYEKQIRKVRRKNEVRRRIMMLSLLENFGETVKLSGEEAGLHLVAEFDGIDQRIEAELVSLAAAKGVGIYSASSLYFGNSKRTAKMQSVKLIIGYAALEKRQIQAGVRVLATVINDLRTRKLKRGLRSER